MSVMDLPFALSPKRTPGKPAVPPRYVIEEAPELAEPLPPLAWVCRGLRVARGSLTIVGGYGYSRKTLYCQSLALSVATGTRALGIYETERMPVVHIDYEQGQRTTRERYQRLARAAGVELATSRLNVITFPRFRLTSDDGRDAIQRILEETRAGLVVLDSLRASIAGVDENSSEIREYLDLMGQEVKRVDAAAIVIHHARKPAEGKGDGRYSLRGSGAIYDACDGVFVFAGEKGQPTTVEHAKDRLEGVELDPFGLDSEDVAQGGDARWGLRLVHLEAEQLREREESSEDSKRKSAVEKAKWSIRKRIAECRGVFPGSRNTLYAEIGGKKEIFVRAIGEMERAGEVHASGSGKETLLSLSVSRGSVP